MRRVVLAVLAVALAFAAPRPVSANFIGPYDVGNWTTTLIGDRGGSVDTSGAPNSILVIGEGHSGLFCDPLFPCIVEFTVAAAASGNVTFHWLYSADSANGPAFDIFGFLLNGSFQQLSDTNGGNIQADTSTFPVVAGDVFGFFLYCEDCVSGGAHIQISEFTGPVGGGAVPAPASLALLITALVGLGLARWRQARP